MMLPRWHILYGAIFTLLLWIIAPNLEWLNLLIIFLSSFLIDFDHYLSAGIHIRDFSILKVFRYYKEDAIKANKEKAMGIRKKGIFQFFHTIEFHILIGVLGIWVYPLFYVFIGMVFHSLIDLYDMAKKDYLYRREFLFYNWMRKAR